jgi:hypothetical protein
VTRHSFNVLVQDDLALPRLVELLGSLAAETLRRSLLERWATSDPACKRPAAP